MEKANTLPLPNAQNDEKNRASPSSSLLSLKSIKTDTLDKMRFMRKKKKKKYSAKVDVDDSPGAYDSNVSDLDGGASEDASETMSLPPTVSSFPSTNNASASPTITRKESSNLAKSPKLVKKPKEAIKNMIKGGKNLLPMFKNKNESAPIMVDTSLDIRRVNRIDDDKRNSDYEAADNAGADERDNEESTVPEVEDEESDDADWSVEATNKKVKKLSVIEITSVYVDNEEEDDGNIKTSLTTPEYELSTQDPLDSSIPSITTTPDITNGDQPPPHFSKKSPSTLKKEILQITNNRKISIPESYIGDKLRHRRVSIQPSTDKNELLFKILVIGELGTGKTSIIKRYVHQFFSQHYRATIGVDFALKVLSWDDSTTIRLQLWDIAGQERFGNMTRVYYKEAVGAFIVFDVTRVGTFEAVTKWKQDLDSKVQLPGGEAIPCVLLANKCDQPKEGLVNNQHKMDDFCKENQFIAWFETSAKDNINIDEAANCLVTRIITDSKRIEPENSNGTGVVNIGHENDEKTKKKFCSFC